MKIGKRAREQAAWICQVAASNPGPTFWWSSRFTSPRAYDLASEATFKAITVDPTEDNRVIHAEAEALLRTGWTP